VPRGSFPAGNGNRVFSGLGRLILDRIDRGVILIDDRRRVKDANVLARRLLAERDGLEVANGRLGFSRADLDERLGRHIAEHRKGNGARMGPLAFQLRHDGRPPSRVVLVPVPPAADQREVAFFLLIYGPPERREISIEVLTEVYGLTRAQAEVARSLFAGRGTEATAAALDLSLNTVRTHLKHIFTRCEVQSQRELLHLLATGPSEL
jgi:DNA-binding CsgD family transcriptional regulator